MIVEYHVASFGKGMNLEKGSTIRLNRLQLAR